MRVVHIIDSLGRGGAETLLINIVKSLKEYEHFVITLFDINEFEEDLKNENHIKVISLRSKSIKNLLLKIFKLRSIVHSISPDVVHSQLYWSNVLARLSTPKNIKLFFTNQSLQQEEAFKQKWQVLLEKYTYSKNQTLISVSAVVEDEYDKFIGIKGHHIILRNFADDAFFLGPKDYSNRYKPLKFITVGRLHPQKNQKLLIEAFHSLSNFCSLSIFGKGPLEKDLKELKSQLMADNVTFFGANSKMFDVLHNYDVFVMSSYYEGFSLAVVEAMASGLPVLLPDLPVFREMGENAAIYFDLNNVQDLQKKIVDLCDFNYLRILSVKSNEQAKKIGQKSNYLRSLKSLYKSEA